MRSLKTSGNTVLVTGGSSGIGFALARAFSNSGNKVIICGRNEEKLQRAKEKLPGIEAKKCDISQREDVESLVRWIDLEYPQLNILVNNAGIQRSIELKKGIQEVDKGQADDEISINFRAQVILSEFFIPNFLKRPEGTVIVNVSSGLAFVPIARFPIYCATKAAIHSFTMSLRYQLKDTKIKIFELIPPTVYDTELKGRPLEKSDWTVSSAEVADAMMKGLETDEFEIAVGSTRNWLRASKNDLDQAFGNINR